MGDIIKLRRDTAANWTSAATVLEAGEPGWDSTNGLLKIGDGSTAFDSLTALGGGSYQPLDSTLTSIAALGTASDKLAYTTGVDTWAETALTSFARALLDDASASAARTTLGVDAAGTDNSTDVTLSGSGTYISIVGQVITVDPITESDISDLQSYLLNITAEPLSDLSDVTITTIASGELLKWNGSAWINNTLAEAGISAVGHNHVEADITDLQSYLLDITAEPLSDLSDVTITSIASGEILVWNGSAWINNTLAEAGIGTGSGDVTKVGTPANNQIGVWTGDGTIEGDSNLVWSGTNLTISGAAHNLAFNNSTFGTFDWLMSQDTAGYLQWTVTGTSGAEMRLYSDGADYTNATLEVGGNQVLTTASNYADVSGTPVNNQLAIWTDADTLEGDADLTYDGVQFDINAYMQVSNTGDGNAGLRLNADYDGGWEAHNTGFGAVINFHRVNGDITFVTSNASATAGNSLTMTTRMNIDQNGVDVPSGTFSLASKALSATTYVQVWCTALDGDTATGDGAGYFHVPPELDGANLVYVHAEVVTAGTTGTTDIQIHNVDNALDMLSTKLTIDSTETGSDTAATPAVINTSNDHVNTNDVLRLDIDAVSTTAAQGLYVTMGFEVPV